MNQFEQTVRRLTREINEQYPRPWMTDLKNPASAKVFIVGYNPATPYRTDSVDYDRYIDSLFNRNGEGCRSFYREVTKSSPTRGNIEMFAEKLKSEGVSEILETNIVCYGAAKKKFLALPENAGGKERGIEIFRTLLQLVQPKAIIVHGSGVVDEFNKAMGQSPALPKPPKTPDLVVQSDLNEQTKVFVVPSLALPGFNNWPARPYKSFCNWADEYLDLVSNQVARVCST